MNPPVGELLPDPDHPVTTPRILHLSLASVGLVSPGIGEVMECAIPVPDDNSRAALALVIFFIDTYLISVHSRMFPLLRPGNSFVMNYFIMLAMAVIKCVLFYDIGVIEGGCNKSCLGPFFFFFSW